MTNMEMKSPGWVKNKIALVFIIVAVFSLGFEAYAIAVVHLEGGADLPENIGNFERIRNCLEQQNPKEKFSFAVVGDTTASRSFRELCDKLRDEPLSFMVILGDFVRTCTKDNHGYFRSECANRYRLPFPVLLVVGNRDVAYDEMHYDINKVSPAEFERMYGKLNFTFEYNGCLFIGLCILPPPYSTKGSIEFLESTLAARHDKNQRVFIFMHMLPIITDDSMTDHFENAQALIDIVNRYKVDYVISSHHYDYAKSKRGETIYLMTGEGGAPLNGKETFGDFHHAVVFTIDRESVSEKAVLAKSGIDIPGAFKHFAITDLYPLLRKHPASAIVENLLVISLLCLFFIQYNVILRSGKT